MICACVQNNIVTAILTADETDPVAFAAFSSQYQYVIDVANLYPTPTIGWTMQGNVLVGPPASTIITRLAFRERFTSTEKAGIYAFAANGTANGFAIQGYLEDLASSTFIDLARPDTQYNVEVLVALGLITQARATVILTTVPTKLELYNG